MMDLENILKKLLPKDKECVIVWHRLKVNEVIKEHVHENFDEYMIIDNGNFSITHNGIPRKFDLNNKTTIITFPAKVKHSLSNGKEEIEYFVVRCETNS